MSYKAFDRKGTRLERKARALQLDKQLAERIATAEAASADATELNTHNAHVAASRAWRRVIYPASRLNQDSTIYREAVRRHIEAAELLQRGHSAQ